MNSPKDDSKMEARFIEQEHRLIMIFLNVFNTRPLQSSDLRRQAAVRALIWRLLSPSTAVLAGGGAVAIGTLVVLIWQTNLIGEQNKYFKEQNDKLQSQIDLQARQGRVQRRTEVIASLYPGSSIWPWTAFSGTTAVYGTRRCVDGSRRAQIELDQSEIGDCCQTFSDRPNGKITAAVSGAESVDMVSPIRRGVRPVGIESYA
jgi:hypothetical protein